MLNILVWLLFYWLIWRGRTSNTRICLSIKPANNVWPSADHANDVHCFSDLTSSATVFVSKSHILIDVPLAAQSQYRFGEKHKALTVSPDGSLCASGGRDGQAMLWDLNDGKHLYTLDSGDTINALCFSPNRYWLCAASGTSIKIWDLETKTVADEVKSEKQCTSLAWSADGQTLFAGFTDKQIRVFEVRQR